MYDIFISYSREDSKVADFLLANIEKHGVKCFIDRRDIAKGKNYAGEIVRGIREASAVLLIHSRKSDVSGFVLREMNSAVTMGKKILPIRIEDFPPCDGMYLYVGPIEFIEAYDGVNEEHVQMILDVLGGSSTKNEPSSKREEYVAPSDSKLESFKVYGTSELIEAGYSAAYMSMKQLELDYITIDGTKYEIDEEVEGTIETWIDSIVECADCSASLIVKNEIVGYLDFFPVSNSNYHLLKTGQSYFSKDYIEFYAFGGNFDIYVSMFSMDNRYATQQNYLLFMEWIYKKLKEWNEKEIHIGNIIFSIYLDSQAKMLEVLGFKKVLENKIQGMLYEGSYEILINNPILRKRFEKTPPIGDDAVTYGLGHPSNRNLVDSCEEIAMSWNVINGGPLHYSDVVHECEIIAYAIHRNEIVGFLAIKEYDCLPSSIYIEQVAITKQMLRKHIGTELLKKAIEYTKNKGKAYIVANVRKDNAPSNAFFNKNGFSYMLMSKEQMKEIGFSEDSFSEQNSYILSI